jgi:3-oxoacyl-[acyl-carrier protein] reductase
MDLGLEGRKALVAGASRGIGLAIATAFAREGAAVGLCARGAEGVRDAVRIVEAEASRPVFGRATDLRDGADTRAFVEEASAALGGIDIYVHSASGFSGSNEEGWAQTLDTDVLAVMRATEAALPSLRDSDAASIVLIGSTASLQWFNRAGIAPNLYGAAKAAQRVLVNELAHMWGRHRIRVNAVSPGSVLVEGGSWGRYRDEQPEQYAMLLKQFPFRRLVEPDEVARAVLFVASPAGSGVNGTHLVVDGGQNIGVQ